MTAVVTGPRTAPVRWETSEAGDAVTVVRADLPSVADERQFAVTLTETDLVRMLSEVRARQLGLDDATGGL